ncbi:MotA/TolQ/ExbB proton channel family protein [Sulfurospirillum barnesii]|uniref:MotA/TolQ/ExbB proton channel domain-containing protein n=1 Tax=Sulfurospirillum barnesii (strain ATCC 700032 / DSM 10660 / SES-3) TaxID=760154 RepID=I3XWJ7_SULBS|nr:MotA/TolQ/ExbB proton channel family protein [Sulfurospirillum barnesii]AFL68321.1 hypothetical protein Sulba_1022 [Sulfurospirillum barnesii SES-3]
MHEKMNEILKDLNTLEHKNSNCAFIYAKLIALPLLAYLYFLLGYVGLLHFEVGTHSIVLIGLIFAVSLLFAKHNAEFGVCVFHNNLNTFNTELHTYIRKNLMRIGEVEKSNASFNNFMDEYVKGIRNDNYASIAAGVFPTMGILGTFISIALTLPDFSSQTASALEHEISILLSGVGTAFYVSIYGILLSLWWLFFEKRGLSRFDKHVMLIQDASAPLFWTKEEIEQAYLKENLQHFEKIGRMFERLSSSDFFERLNRTIEGKFSLFDEMLKLEGEAVKKSAEHFKTGMETLARSSEKQRNLVQIHEDMLSKLNAFNANSQALHVKMQESNKAILASQQDLLRSLKESALIQGENEPNLEVELLKESLKMIDAETEEIIHKMDTLR